MILPGHFSQRASMDGRQFQPKFLQQTGFHPDQSLHLTPPRLFGARVKIQNILERAPDFHEFQTRLAKAREILAERMSVLAAI
jgi:hypothetical protein